VQYCPTDDTIFFDRQDALKKVYDQTGDFGPMSLIAVAFGQAARKRLGQSVNGEPALLSSICLAGAYAGTCSTGGDRRRSCSPRRPGRGDPGAAQLRRQGRVLRGQRTAGFDRVAAYNKGFADIRSCG